MEESYMVYRNGVRECFLTALLFGGMMGILSGLLALRAWIGVIGGIVSGALFSFLLFLFCKAMDKKYDSMRAEIAKERKIFCDGVATVQGVGGWMFFTENGLEFYPHKINYIQDEQLIPIRTIKTVGTKGNQIVIDTTENLKFAVHVSQNKQWKREIENVIS